jgi:hypothetical protein
MIPVEGNPDLYRDEKTNAILNCNDNKYNEYITMKGKLLNQKHEIEHMKNDIDEIKSLLKVLVNKINT